MNTSALSGSRRKELLCCFAFAAICLPVMLSAQVEARLASASVGPGGIMRSGGASLNVSLATVGLVAAADSVKSFPGFPGDLPNVPPNASYGLATRMVGEGVEFSALAAVSRSTDPDGDRLRVVAVERESIIGAQVELDGDRITYISPPGFDFGDSFEYTLADSYGDTDTGRIRIRALPPPPDDPFRSRADADGRPQLRFRGTPGTAYQIQTSTSIVQPILWQTIAETTADATGLISYPVPSVPGEAVRYYRASP